MEGSGGEGGEAEFYGIESTGFGDAFAGEDFGEESIIGGEIDATCLGADGEGGSIGADAWIDDLRLVTVDHQLRELIRNSGAVLVGYRALRDAMRAG
jgi:hypothetical protein